jgi:hypothetical protein
MPLDWFSESTSSQWIPWASGTIGLLFALLIFLWARRLVGRRRSARNDQVSPSPALLAGTSEKDPFVFGSAEEKRQAVRRQGNPVSVLISDAAGTAPPSQGGLVQDRSVGGLCLALHEAVGVGSILSIRPANAASVIPWVQIEVRSCRKTNIGWEAGCQFVRTPPSSVLWSFG